MSIRSILPAASCANHWFIPNGAPRPMLWEPPSARVNSALISTNSFDICKCFISRELNTAYRESEIFFARQKQLAFSYLQKSTFSFEKPIFRSCLHNHPRLRLMNNNLRIPLSNLLLEPQPRRRVTVAQKNCPWIHLPHKIQQVIAVGVRRQ